MSKCMHPGLHHSDDLVEVWHGYEEPALGCGYHATQHGDELLLAHNARLAGWVVSRPGPGVPGSHGQTDESGRMVWTAGE